MLREIHANKLKQRRKGLPDAPNHIPQKFIVVPGYRPEPTPPPRETESIAISPIRSSASISSASTTSMTRTEIINKEIASRRTAALTIPLESDTLNKSTESRRTSFRVQPSLSRQKKEFSEAPSITPQKRPFDVQESEIIASQSSTTVQQVQIVTKTLAVCSSVGNASHLDQEQTLEQTNEQPHSPSRSVKSTAGGRESSIRSGPPSQAASIPLEDNVDHGPLEQASPTLREDVEMDDDNAVDIRTIKKVKETEVGAQQTLTLQMENVQYLSTQKAQEEPAASAAENHLGIDTAQQIQEDDKEFASTPKDLMEEQQTEKDMVEKEFITEEEMSITDDEVPAPEELSAPEEIPAGEKITVEDDVVPTIGREESTVADEPSFGKEVEVESEESAVEEESAVVEEDVNMTLAAQDNQDEEVKSRHTVSPNRETAVVATTEQQDEKEADTTEVQAPTRETSPTASTPKQMSLTPTSPQVEQQEQEETHTGNDAQLQTHQEETDGPLLPIPGLMDMEMDDPLGYDYDDYQDNEQEEQSVSVDEELVQKRQALQKEFGDLDEEELNELIEDLEVRAAITSKLKVIKLANLHLEALKLITTEAMVEAKRSFNDPFATSISGDYHNKVITAYAKRQQAYLEYIRYSSGLDRLKKIEKEYNDKKFHTEVERRQVKKESDLLRKEIAALDAEKQELLDLDDFLSSVKAML